MQNFKTDYDYDSVMHYGNTAFSKNGKITIKPIKANVIIGQRNGFSALDIQEINALYQCTSEYIFYYHLMLMDKSYYQFSRFVGLFPIL